MTPERGAVVKLVEDWTTVTRGEEWAVVGPYDSAAYGECVELKLIERLPEGRVALTENKVVPVGFVKDTGATVPMKARTDG